MLGASEPQITDICSDLAPGVRNESGRLGFADEDFEHFVREAGEPAMAEVQARTADRFLANASSSAYAALNVAPALLATNRRRELLDLVEREPEPTVATMPDPVRRREVQVQRLQVAIKVCREADDPARALRFVLIGAEAIGTKIAMRSLLASSPGLSASYARETASRLILGDADMLSEHGPLLLHLMAEDATRGDAISVREGRRRMQAWGEARKDSYEAEFQKYRHASPWKISPEDVSAGVYSTLLLEGAARAIAHFARIRPLRFAYWVAKVLVARLLAEDRANLVEALAAELHGARVVFLLVPLALAGRDVDLDRLARGLLALKRRFALDGRVVMGLHDHEDKLEPYAIDTLLTAAEILVARGGNKDVAMKVVEPFLDTELRRIDRCHDFETSLLDAILRSLCLSEAINGREAKAGMVLTARPKPVNEPRNSRLSGDEEQHDRQLRELVEALIQFYVVRARMIAGAPLSAEALGKALGEAQGRLERESWRLERRLASMAMRAKAAESLAVLLAVGVKPELVMTQAATILGGWWSHTGVNIRELFERLAAVPALHDRLVTEIAQAAEAVRQRRTGAEEKSKALVAFARLLSMISPDDADVIFKQAVEVTSQLDSKIMDQLRLTGQLVEHGGSGFCERAGESAVGLAELIYDAAIRLKGFEDFPWSESLSALARLDLPLALACVARWDDAQVVSLGQALGPVVGIGLETGRLSLAQAVSLCSLEDRIDGESLLRVCAAAEKEESEWAAAISEELAHDILVERVVGSGSLSDFVALWGVGPWSGRLRQQRQFEATLPETTSIESAPPIPPVAREPSLLDAHIWTSLLDAHIWTVETLTRSEALGPELEDLIARSRAAKQYITTEEVLTAARAQLPMKHRVEHLNALAGLENGMLGSEVVRTILKATDEWVANPAVRNWCVEKLPNFIADHLPMLARNLPWESLVAPVLAKAQVTDAQSQDILLQGLERSVDHLNASATFALAGMIGCKLPPKETAELCIWYIHRLAARIDASDLEGVSPRDRPQTVDEAVARFIYACLGDVDHRQRWRAAHASRRLARLGDAATFHLLADQYERREEPAFRERKVPFYWIAARLWFVIALDRICLESPSIADGQGPRLLEIASSQQFPHVLIRAYAADACYKLIDAGRFTPTAGELAALANVNKSQLPRGTNKPEYHRGFNWFNSRDDKEYVRFSFNEMDTIPYWYRPWLRAFDDVALRVFLEAAEHWIVDKWSVQDEPLYSREPRQKRFSDEAWRLSSIRHGSVPTLERYQNYLEWHAMWCVVGQLLQTHALATLDCDEDDELTQRIQHSKLTVPPIWLADLCSPKPLEKHRWRAPEQPLQAWLNDVSDEAFLAELISGSRPGYIVVDAYIEARARTFHETIRVSTGLVSPGTARALVRALQTIEVSSDYYICPEGHDLEIEESGYTLQGWLQHTERDPGLDDKDTFRNGIRRIEAAPGKLVTAVLGLRRCFSPEAQWLREVGESPSFVYEAWGEYEPDESRERFYNDTVVYTGHRLLARVEDLTEFLNNQERDLIAEVGIERRDRGNQQSSYESEDAQENEFDRLLLLRRDGTIQAAERDLGTWRPPCS